LIRSVVRTPPESPRLAWSIILLLSAIERNTKRVT